MKSALNDELHFCMLFALLASYVIAESPVLSLMET
jgi:hypothetical protein